ncbi:MAG: hypothetical protein LBT97_07760, partial [Planctomycetota bacterium]|nr:hypothetical protein [Planctomycetota bacterium]
MAPGASSIILSSLDVRCVVLPFRMRVSHSLASRDSAETLLVSVATPGGERGYGQALPRSYLTGETVEEAEDSIRNQWWPAIRALE